MTCIVGLVENGHVYVGGDSAGVGGYFLSARGDHKVFANGEFAFGFTSSFRMGQLLRYKFTPPACHTWDVERYMATDFVDALRLCLKDGGYARNDSGEETAGAFLVGFRGRLFKIESDYQVAFDIVPFNACGCGQEIALGAMFAIHSTEQPPEKKLTIALQAAEAYSAGVRGPFNIVSV